MNKTIKTSTKVLSNTVLAAALMMGNVNVQTSQDYYEDKEGFHQVSTSMENGWGWSLGFNKANANTCSNNLITNCEVGEGEDTTEHIPVVGQRPPTEPWQGVPDESTEDYGSTSGGSGGSGSGGSSTPTPPKPNEIDEQEQCEINALEAKGNCVTVAEGLHFTAAALCLGFGPSPATVACEGAALVAFSDAKAQCDVDYAKAVALCD
ncbi:hypothetical protein SG34_028795 [Thalassomonas viridans]|uniref:Secreted protein n=1 Tax=Thalassomonas viridans TaxID=137584 RepID=A0AAE9Z1T3_9GAMM|nr:hypothetical protein [Thalassomonas viridans]WDE05241.1 hypothetical protein SG34_028795 [Thalassomonas viridans]